LTPGVVILNLEIVNQQESPSVLVEWCSQLEA